MKKLIIIGANKSATTSLFTYLSWHPDICPSKVKETNFFTPLFYDKRLKNKREYYKYFNCHEKQKYMLEATPNYIYGRKMIAKAIYNMLGDVIIILILRDPTYRLLSYFNHMKRNNELGKEIDFNQFVEKSISETEKKKKNNIDFDSVVNVYKENIFIRGINQGIYINFIPDWKDIYGNNFKIFFYENLIEDTKIFMLRLAELLGIDKEFYKNKRFTIENSNILYRKKSLHLFAEFINDKFEVLLRKHWKIKKFIRTIYWKINEKKEKKCYAELGALEKLNRLYYPYNKKLRNFLSEENNNYEFPKWLKV